MLLTATTLKDSPENVRFFVAANLASGVDHMIVFLDSPQEPEQREVGALLDDHPHVTCLRTDRKAWWLGDRPAGLNVRQRINANWARDLLAPFGWAEWLFHVDGDEVALLDRAALAEVPPSADAVWLPPLEAVSRLRPERRPTLFKRLLDDDDLALLHVLGAIDAPTNQAYFHGHVMGKSGVRPRSGLALTLHGVVGTDGRRHERHTDARLALLHYDAVSGEEFVRKWSALAGAGHARYRADRAPVARALRTLVTKDMSEEARARHLRRIYELTTLDDVDLLAELRLLVEADPEAGAGTPAPLPADARDALAARVAEQRQHPKRPYFVAEEAERQRVDRHGRGDGATAPDRARRSARRLGKLVRKA